jgi:hypothetical protein
MNTLHRPADLDAPQPPPDAAEQMALYRHFDKLDALGRRLGLGSLLDICDCSGRPATGTTPGDLAARQTSWLALPDALRLLEGLVDHLRRRPVRFGIFTNDYAQVVSELEEALGIARALALPDTRIDLPTATRRPPRAIGP